MRGGATVILNVSWLDQLPMQPGSLRSPLTTRQWHPSDSTVDAAQPTNFKIAAAQVPSVRGDIDANIAIHAAAMAAAARHGVTVLVFPELSLTGYEPDLAAELAM